MATNINRLIGKRIADRYRITGEIGVGGMGRVFRAMPFDDPSQDVAIKVILRNRQLNAEDLLRFQKEAALMSRLHHQNIVCFHELGLLESDGQDEKDAFSSGYYIVMEIAEGVNLKESLEQEGRKDLAYFFQVGLQVTEALDYTHGKNIIHRDIKPHNIIVGKANQEDKGLIVKILDFGVARLNEAMHFSSSDGAGHRQMHDIAGTPLYMAPEQTQLMDAPIDHRVDLYSLGCVLYEILTGRPPFTSNTRDKLERQHAFDQPEPLTSLRPDVPPIIERIIHKLLSKHPDERYQTAFSVHSDLARAKRRLERRERPQLINFPLALNDQFHAVAATLPLIGRTEQMQALRDAYEATATEKGRSRLTVVKGDAGLGKTRLLTEMRHFLLKRKIRFISTNFSRHENALPFNALANGFNDYLLRVLKSQPHEAEELRRKVKTLLGPTAFQVAAVVPGLHAFISEEQQPVEEAENKDDFQTFSKAFSDFTRCLAIDNQPVVFLFDDLHWADQKSLELIDQFFSHNNSQRFFMIVGYRGSDPMTSHRFYRFLEKFSKLRRRFEEIELKPFSPQNVKEMIECMLNTNQVADESLINFFQIEANGNPMQIVETMRALVASDLVKYDHKSQKWTYQINEIREAHLKYQSIDLVLSKIQNFNDADREVLEICAVTGLAFQFETLVLSKKYDPIRVTNALTRAIDEGLIYRVREDPTLSQLGKTYRFSHWRVRDIIYQNISPDKRRNLHEAIADRFQHLIDKPSAKSVFALAHHINSAVVHEKAENEKLAIRCVETNISAGQESMRAEAWVSAQKYFENAYNQIKQWPHLYHIQREMFYVIEKLGDLAALQRRHRSALQYYDQLWGKPIDDQTRVAIAYKTLSLQLVGGIVSQSIGQMLAYFNQLKLPIPKQNIFNFFGIVSSLLLEVLPLPKKFKRIYQTVRIAVKNYQRYAGEPGGVRLYHLGQQLLLQHRPSIALYYHHFLYRSCLRGEASTYIVIKMVGDRAAILARYGFIKAAYQLMDTAIEASRHLQDKQANGYLIFLRAAMLDYVKDKDEEIARNVRRSLRYMGSEFERVWYGSALEFRIFRELMQGNTEKVLQLSKIIPETLPTRNWLSPRAFAMAFYVQLLTDARDSLVHNGESYLRRRDKVRGRPNDLYVLIIKSMVAFARGDVDKCRSIFRSAVHAFVNSLSHQLLFPFEEDFCCLFFLSFPLLYHQEYGRNIFSSQQMREFFIRLDARVKKIPGKNRGFKALVTARLAEVFKRGGVKGRYDFALKFFKINNQKLGLIFTYLWFGDYLFKTGNKDRSDYLLKALKLSDELRTQALSELIGKVLERRKIPFNKLVYDKKSPGFVMRRSPFRSNLVFDHLANVCALLKLDTAIEQDLEESIAILSREYKCRQVYLALNEEALSERNIYNDLLPQPEERRQINKYVEPYIHIRSTLFLPLSDAPWIAGNYTSLNDEKSVPLGEVGSTDVTHVHSQFSAMDEETVVLADQHSTQPQSLSTESTQPVSSHKYIDIEPVQSLQLSALVPVRGANINYGVLYLEDIDFSDKDSPECRNELDVFGAQLGLLIDEKLRASTRGSDQRSQNTPRVPLRYRSGSYQLEPVEWLRVWTHGGLRKDRESTWFLGLNIGSGHYLLSYVRLNGNEKERTQLSQLLWYQLHIFRALLVNSGRHEFTVSEIKEDISAYLTSFSQTRNIDAFAFSFTLFKKGEQLAESGHFGPSRPLVLCKENFVKPENRVILSLHNGRDIRYWDVQASMNGPHAYILAHDTSRLEISLSAESQKSFMTSLLASTVEQKLHHILERMVLKDNIPRYYVGVIFTGDETGETEAFDEIYDKAE